jgi:predicted ester cyclase
MASGDGGNLNALGRYLHDDVVIHDPGGATAIGIDHEKETWRKARNAMPGLRHELQEVVCEGSTVAARVELSGSNPLS